MKQFSAGMSEGNKVIESSGDGPCRAATPAPIFSNFFAADLHLDAYVSMDAQASSYANL